MPSPIMSISKKAISGIISQLRGNNLKARSSRGALTLATGTGFERVLRLVRNMILARLLAPEHFGLMALVMATSQLVEILTEVGIRQAVVQYKDATSSDYLNVAWWFNAARGVAMYVVGWLAAPLLAGFYQEPEFTSLLRVAFLVVLFHGLTSPGLFVLEKQLKFARVVVVRQGSGLIGTLLSLVLVIYYPNVWSLVIGFVATAFFGWFGSFLVYPFWPKLRFERQVAAALFRFSKGMVGLPVLTYIYMQADIFALGRIVGSEGLGYYSLTLTLAMVPQMLFSQIVQPMILPVFAEMQDDKGRMRENLLRMTKLLFLFGLPMVVCLGIFAEPILSIVYGERYGQVHGVFAVLSLYMLLYAANIFIASVYWALGRPEIYRPFAVLQVALIVLCIYPAVSWAGVTGAACARLAALSLSTVVQLLILRKVLDLPIYRYLETTGGGLLLAAIAALPAMMWRWWIDSPWLEVLGVMVLCGLAWLAVIWNFRGAVKDRMSGRSTLQMAKQNHS